MKGFRVGSICACAAALIGVSASSALATEPYATYGEIQVQAPSQLTSEPQAGADAIWDIMFDNAGPSTMPAGDVTISDELAPGEKYVSAKIFNGGGSAVKNLSCTVSGQTVNCTMGAIAMTSSPQLEITVKETKAGKIHDTSSVTVPAGDTLQQPGDDGGTSPAVTVKPAQNNSEKPYVYTGYDNTIGQAGMTIAGYAYPYGAAQAYYEWGHTKSYGHRTAVHKISGSKKNRMKATITHLKLNTKYHWRLVVVRGGKKYYGHDESATTFGPHGYPDKVTLKWKPIKGGLSFSGKIYVGPFPGPVACTGKAYVQILNIPASSTLVTSRKVKLRHNCTYSVSIHSYTKADADAAGPKGTIKAQMFSTGNYDIRAAGTLGVTIH